jgi:hypothetical protein
MSGPGGPAAPIPTVPTPAPAAPALLDASTNSLPIPSKEYNQWLFRDISAVNLDFKIKLFIAKDKGKIKFGTGDKDTFNTEKITELTNNNVAFYDTNYIYFPEWVGRITGKVKKVASTKDTKTLAQTAKEELDEAIKNAGKKHKGNEAKIQALTTEINRLKALPNPTAENKRDILEKKEERSELKKQSYQRMLLQAQRQYDASMNYIKDVSGNPPVLGSSPTEFLKFSINKTTLTCVEEQLRHTSKTIYKNWVDKKYKTVTVEKKEPEILANEGTPYEIYVSVCHTGIIAIRMLIFGQYYYDKNFYPKRTSSGKYPTMKISTTPSTSNPSGVVDPTFIMGLHDSQTMLDVFNKLDPSIDPSDINNLPDTNELYKRMNKEYNKILSADKQALFDGEFEAERDEVFKEIDKAINYFNYCRNANEVSARLDALEFYTIDKFGILDLFRRLNDALVSKLGPNDHLPKNNMSPEELSGNLGEDYDPTTTPSAPAPGIIQTPVPVRPLNTQPPSPGAVVVNLGSVRVGPTIPVVDIMAAPSTLRIETTGDIKGDEANDVKDFLKQQKTALIAIKNETEVLVENAKKKKKTVAELTADINNLQKGSGKALLPNETLAAALSIKSGKSTSDTPPIADIGKPSDVSKEVVKQMETIITEKVINDPGVSPEEKQEATTLLSYMAEKVNAYGPALVATVGFVVAAYFGANGSPAAGDALKAVVEALTISDLAMTGGSNKNTEPKYYGGRLYALQKYLQQQQQRKQKQQKQKTAKAQGGRKSKRNEKNKKNGTFKLSGGRKSRRNHSHKRR